jgi:alkylation response protein AidB-like acyl-CoA dehydrogenase
MTALGAEHDTERVAGLAAEAQRRFGPFVHEWVNPGADARDRTGQPLPRELLREAGRLGLTGFSLPPEAGGQGRDRFDWGIVVEEVARISRDPGLTSAVDVTAGVAEVLIQTSRPELIERYAVPMAAGACVCPPAAYEGRDPFDYLTTAREADGGWRLDGSKPFVGGALVADAFLVYAREEESGDILSFVVERGDEGVCVDPLPTAGLRSLGFGTLGLDRVRLPGERLVAGADALSAMNAYLRNRRLTTACAVVGHMRAHVEACVLALQGRQRGGRGVLELPNVQRTVGELFAAVHASRAMVHRALEAADVARDQFFDPLATVAKQFAAEQAIRVGLAVMDLQGGEGYMRRHPWERYMRDALGLIGGQGAQELLLVQLGQHVTSELQQRQVRMEKAQRTIAELTEGSPASTAFASALEGGLLDQLLTPVTADEAAGCAGAPPEQVDEVLHVLAGTGLVSRRGDRFAVSDGLGSILAAGPLRAAVAAEGGAAAALADLLLGRLAQELDGLDERLHRPDARLLVAGTGPATLAVELRRRLPDAHVVGIDPAAEATAVAERAVAEAGRVDVAWLPAGCLSPAAPRYGLPAVLRWLRAGGWALLPVQRACPAGEAPPADELARLLDEAGFGRVQVVPVPLPGTPYVVAGRRVRGGS